MLTSLACSSRLRAPDLNPLENVWKSMKDRVAAHRPRAVADLQHWVRYEWANLKMTYFRAATFDMPHSLDAAIQAGGAVTRF